MRNLERLYVDDLNPRIDPDGLRSDLDDELESFIDYFLQMQIQSSNDFRDIMIGVKHTLKFGIIEQFNFIGKAKRAK